MVKEIKELWVEALRSGHYKQGQRWLHRKIDGKELFCCLGVLCEILGVLPIKAGLMGAYSFNGSRTNLTIPFRYGVEMTCQQEGLLTMMNDGLNYNFNTIASYIEANL